MPGPHSRLARACPWGPRSRDSPTTRGARPPSRAARRGAPDGPPPASSPAASANPPRPTHATAGTSARVGPPASKLRPSTPRPGDRRPRPDPACFRSLPVGRPPPTCPETWQGQELASLWGVGALGSSFPRLSSPGGEPRWVKYLGAQKFSTEPGPVSAVVKRWGVNQIRDGSVLSRTLI